MKNILQNTMLFAVAQSGRIVHIDDVANGYKCECFCPACNAPLIAKNEGAVRSHHFAHDGRFEEHSCSETALHYAAKQIIADNKKIMLPEAPIWNEGGGCALVEFSNVILEHKLDSGSAEFGHIVADCLGIAGSESLIIEIAVHHQVDLVKFKKIQSMNTSAIEISLADFACRNWDWLSLTHEVLFNVQRRKWLWQAEVLQAEEIISKEADVTHIEVGVKKEWIFDIGGHWVWVEKLPYSNFKVFHRPSAYVRSVVEPLCRNRGFWRAPFNCWVVWDQCIDDVFKGLAAAGKLTDY